MKVPLALPAISIALSILVWACTQSSDAGYAKQDEASSTDDVAATDDNQNDSGDGNVPRGPLSITLDGDANGIFWDKTTKSLFLADDDNNRVLVYKDGVGISKYADLPAASASGPGLGQLVKSADGSIVVTRFGFGAEGDVVVIDSKKRATVVPNLDKTRRRIGLAVAPNGDLYNTYFVKTGSGDVGVIAKLTLDGTETTVADGLKKPIGVIATATDLLFSDQQANALYRASIGAPSEYTHFADLPDADLITLGSKGSIFAAAADGTVRQVDASGNVSSFATGFAAVRGVAYDDANRRLFLVNHTGTSGSNTLEIRPVP